MDHGKSTRVSIVEQGLTDVFERLNDMAPSARVRELRARAQSYERVVQSWATQPPTEEQRKTMTKCVLDLNVEVIDAARETT